MIHIQNLSIQDSQNRSLVENVDLSVSKGEFLGIVGESGSGKTLTTKALLGCVPKSLSVTADLFEVAGEDPRMLDRKEQLRFWGTRFGYVVQNTTVFLHPLIPIRKQIIDGYVCNGFGSKQEALARAETLLMDVGIPDVGQVLHAIPSQLSGGMRQRVNIATAMMCNPEIIIADEPTSALDIKVGHQVMSLLKHLHEENGHTLIMVTHDLNMVQKYCERVAVMQAGKVVETGSVQTVFTLPQHPYTKHLLKSRLSQPARSSL